ncbi:MAG: D-Ala-D-Ala carboxypeptidase family metallohydrolase [Weeksellaceae bacterium]|nr:D-Ala-D-Ala carboxypeptidase family metallohydrolase [Weeksellaceae bacterium]
MRITTNFRTSEFDSKDGSPMPPAVRRNVVQLAKSLQALRDSLGVPVLINSGYRSPAHNARIGGVRNSQHVTGRAADITARPFTPAQVAARIERLIKEGKMKEGAVGIYSTFVHYDTRGQRVRFRGNF